MRLGVLRVAGKYQLKINEWCIKKGGHTRTGMEDNIRLIKIC